MSVLSLLVDSNRRVRQRAALPFAPALAHFNNDASALLSAVSAIVTADNPLTARSEAVLFLTNVFAAGDNELLRKAAFRLVALPLWIAAKIPENRVQAALADFPHIAKQFAQLKRSRKGVPRDCSILPDILNTFFEVLNANISEDKTTFLGRVVQLCIDLLSQLPTRRFFHLFFDDTNFVVRCRRSKAFEDPVLRTLLRSLEICDDFPVDDFSGESFSEAEIVERGSKKAQHLQGIVFQLFPDKLKDLYLSNIGAIENAKKLAKMTDKLSNSELRKLCAAVNLLPEEGAEVNDVRFGNLKDRKFVVDVFCHHYEKRKTLLDEINQAPYMPTEDDLWGSKNAYFEGSGDNGALVPLPKLNLQFLSIRDYLERNYLLFSRETFFGVRTEIEDALRKMFITTDKKTGTAEHFSEAELLNLQGKSRSRHVLPVRQVDLVRVTEPRLGEVAPSEVVLDVMYTLEACNLDAWKEEWDSVKRGDIVFLVRMDRRARKGSTNFMEKHGILCVRCGEVEEIADEKGTGIGRNVVDMFGSKKFGPRRKMRVKIDPVQHLYDVNSRGNDYVSRTYSSFNLVIRRKSKFPNFKTILENIRHLMNNEFTVPDWMEDVLCGYGSVEKPKEEDVDMESAEKTLNFFDTFVSESHLKKSFPNGKKVTVKQWEKAHKMTSQPLYSVTFGDDGQITASAFEPLCPPEKRNTVPFTPAQVDAIRAGMDRGLTLIVGPPGTGKSDVAVQIVQNLYHSHPQQRILVVTKSNDALDQIFEKIVKLDIDQRFCLRLGRGENMKAGADFSPSGRIAYILERRSQSLELVEKLAASLDVPSPESFAANCAAATTFQGVFLNPLWEAFNKKCEEEKKKTSEFLEKNFPFTKFFTESDNARVPKLAFTGKFEEDFRAIKQCWYFCAELFTEIQDFRAMEILRSQKDRTTYLLTKQTKIVAMTCTGAALRMKELMDMGFAYDTLVMEEAAQILEIESFIPLILQPANKVGKTCRLNRVVMVGDNNQLSPIVWSPVIASQGGFDQSMFVRLARLGTPIHMLDRQGRCRPSISELFKWRYPELDDLPHVNKGKFSSPNPGLLHEFQLINVEDFDDCGEQCPAAHFFVNVGEGEYAIQLYKYLRLIGYPRESIAILTTYKGQCALLKNIAQARCPPHVELPAVISTVDSFQGREADIVILSLVRTLNPGHIVDPRRMTVAFSRARLGLYVLCRQRLFAECEETKEAFGLFEGHPSTLCIVSGEKYGDTKLGTQTARKKKSKEVADVDALADIVCDMEDALHAADEAME